MYTASSIAMWKEKENVKSLELIYINYDKFIIYRIQIIHLIKELYEEKFKQIILQFASV